MDESDPQANRGIGSSPPPMGGPRVSCIQLEDDEVFVLSTPLPEIRYPAATTPAEYEIIDLLLEGHTVEEIAIARNASRRTVATQLTEIYRKAGVGSLRQLATFALGVDGWRNQR